jgi:hypothetical protein
MSILRTRSAHSTATSCPSPGLRGLPLTGQAFNPGGLRRACHAHPLIAVLVNGTELAVEARYAASFLDCLIGVRQLDRLLIGPETL